MTTYRAIYDPIQSAVIDPTRFESAAELMDWLVRAGLLEIVEEEER